MTVVSGHDAGIRGRVLLIDDDTATLAVLTKALAREGFDVESASSAREALTRLTRSDFDVVVSDIRMPEFDGRQLFAFIQDHFPDYRRRLIFLTGDSSAETQQFIAQTQALHFTKPPDLRKLLDTVSSVTIGRRQVMASAVGTPISVPAAPMAAAAGSVADVNVLHEVSRLSMETAQLRREVADRDAEIQNLTARLDRAAQEVAASRLQVTTSTEELNGLRDEIVEKERDLTRVTRKLERAEGDAKIQAENLHRELERVRQQVAQTVAELESHRSESSRRQAELQAVRSEVARRENELEQERRRFMSREAELEAKLRSVEGGGTPALIADPATELRAQELEETLASFYQAAVRPVTIAAAHLEMAAGAPEQFDAESLQELDTAMKQLKRDLAELAQKMERQGIKVVSG